MAFISIQRLLQIEILEIGQNEKKHRDQKKS